MHHRKARVFISCGQRDDERIIAESVAELLRKSNFEPYLACKVMSLESIMSINKDLSSSDYFIFIDFLREVNENNELPISLFSHQELALAHQLGFKNEIIALRQEGVPEKHGFIWYVLSNAEYFKNGEDLLKKLKKLIISQKWDPNFSRNLVISDLIKMTDVHLFTDHTGSYRQKVAEITIENRRTDIAAVDTVCILDSIYNSNKENVYLHDRTYLKWSGQKGYHKTILPNDSGEIAAFAINYDGNNAGIFLNSARDVTKKEPIIKEIGTFYLHYKIFSKDFPLLLFKIKLDSHWADFEGRRILEADAKIIP